MGKTEQIMTTEHPEWDRFVNHLYGPEGINAQNEGETWTCNADDHSLPLARGILAKYFPEIDVEATVSYFHKHGGGCDCEILLNVDPVCSGHAD